MTKQKRIILALLIIVLSVGCDQITKVIAREDLPEARELAFAGVALRLDYNVNEGAVFSFE